MAILYLATVCRTGESNIIDKMTKMTETGNTPFGYVRSQDAYGVSRPALRIVLSHSPERALPRHCLRRNLLHWALQARQPLQTSHYLLRTQDIYPGGPHHHGRSHRLYIATSSSLFLIAEPDQFQTMTLMTIQRSPIPPYRLRYISTLSPHIRPVKQSLSLCKGFSYYSSILPPSPPNFQSTTGIGPESQANFLNSSKKEHSSHDTKELPILRSTRCPIKI